MLFLLGNPVGRQLGPVSVMVLLMTLTAIAQENGDEQNRAEAALQLTRDYASRYEFFSRDETKACPLISKPILRWSNPERGQIFGNVFLWTRNGRPFAVGSLYKWYSPWTHMSHEFHSLSTAGLRATYDGKEVWHIDQVGLKFVDLPMSPEVAAIPAARLAQMRQLARQFVARSTDAEGRSVELRLLSQPVYRYESTMAGDDGALFSFVHGTDPEVWLLLEAQAQASGKPGRWTYALARMNSIQLAAEYQGNEVWRVPAISHREFTQHVLPYTKYHFDDPKP